MNKFIEDVLKHNKISKKEWDSHLKDVTSIDDVELPVIPLEKDIQKYFQEKLDSSTNVLLSVDYDSDGLTGGVVLYKYLKHIGFNVFNYIPKRSDGYGMNKGKIDDFHIKNNIGLIITCDCGISNKDEVAHANKLGIDVFITDHHEIPLDPSDYPESKFTLHPKITEGLEPMVNFSGSGMAYYLCHMLEKHFKSGFPLDEWQCVAAIGTIGDMTDLVGLNRDFVKAGINKFKTSNIAGIKALKEISGVDPNLITEEDLSFKVIPRINAAGRMADPIWAFATLATDDYKAALRSAKILDKINEERKVKTREYLEIAKSQCDPSKPAIIVYGEFNHGIVGLTASDLVGEYNLPAFVLADEGDIYKGSARAPEWYSVIDGLRYAGKDIDYKYGGHKAAGGFSLKKEDLNEFISLIESSALSQMSRLSKYHGIKNMKWKKSYDEVNLLESLELLRPFGQGFLAPTFEKKVTPEKVSSCRNDVHLFCKIDGYRATGFYMYSHDLTRKESWDIIYSLRSDIYKRKNPYLSINIHKIK